jgi:DNA invertase Pin-like site-specific DNA recombinase
MPAPINTQDLLKLLRAGQPKAPKDVDTTSVRYALYTRKSTTSEDRQASSIEDQVDDCYEKVIIPNELNVVKTYQESYSAKVADMRDEFNAMIKEIESGNIDGVIAWHPDRLSRNMKEAGAIIDLVDRGLIRDLQFATFTFENTPAGKMLLGITFVMAKQYSEHLAESVDRGNKRAVEGGEFIGKFKHGYILDINRYFRPDPLNFAKIAHMFEMALSGKSQKDIRLWINEQDYTVQKLQGEPHQPHKWDKDDVSKLLRDPHYVGVHKWGKTHTDLTELYDFQPMLTVPEFLTINKVDSLDNAKVLTIHRPRTGNIKADLLRGMVYCGKCDKTLTSMLIPKRDRETGEIKEERYYYKCETEGCSMYNKSARAGLVVDTALYFFQQYLFVTKTNYATYLEQAVIEAKRKSAEFDTAIARLKILIANKEKVYEEMKDLILKNPEMKDHYDLNKHVKAIEKLKTDYRRAIRQKDNIKAAIPTFEEYLKLLQTTPVALGKIRDMKVMDALLRIFFSNFTIIPAAKDNFKGSTVSYKLNEPWKGFVDANDFVLGAA